MQVTMQPLLSMLTEMSNLLNKNNNESGMSNKDLEVIGRKCLKKFKGVYPSDSFPSVKQNAQFFSIIFNLSHHDKPGTHFIAVVKKQKEIFYFDSFGLPCTVKSLKKSLSQISKEIIISSKKLQSFNSIFCSFFCLAFILHLQKDNMNNMTSFLKIFSKSPNIQANDLIVKRYVKKEITKLICKNKKDSK